MDAPNKEFALAGSLEELKGKGRLVVPSGRAENVARASSNGRKEGK
jgi:hypothetical protein